MAALGEIKSRRVLLIEDNSEIADLITLYLVESQYAVERVGDGRRGLSRALSGEHDLVILDIVLPELDGFEVCRRIRENTTRISVLMLTTKSSALDKVRGLDTGADDYLTKPFSLLELMARVNVLFRRMGHESRVVARSAVGGVVIRRDLRIDPDRRTVFAAEKPVDLTAKEFNLLTLLADNPGRVYNRTQLLDLVWGYDHEGYEHTVNSHINRLRAKIEANPSEPQYILTVWGVGYKFNESAP